MATAALCLLRFSPLSPPKNPGPNLHLRSSLTHNPLRRLSTCTPAPRPLPPTRLVSMSYSPPVPATERLISALSYSLPFFNSLHYGRFLFARFPSLAAPLAPLLPLLSAYRAVPFASFVAFFALYLGVVRNSAFSRYVRFNAMQAVVLDVLLALPTLAQRIFGGMPSRGVGFRVVEFGYDFIFLFTVACFIYGLVSSVLGKTPYLPIVASAADRQL